MLHERGTYSFPSFEAYQDTDVEEEIRNRFNINESFHREWIDIRFCRSCPGISGEAEVILDCYIVDISESLFVPKDLEYVDKRDVAEKHFAEEQSKVAELFEVIPSIELLDNDRLLGQVIVNKESDQIKISLTSSRLLEKEVQHAREGYFPLYFCEFTSNEIIAGSIEEDGVFFYSIEIFNPLKHDNMSIEHYIDGKTDFVAAIKGSMFFSSSPVKTEKEKQIIIWGKASKKDADKYDELLKEWNSIISNPNYAIRKNNDIVNELKNVYSRNTPKEIKAQIYNVGQANCCYCDLQFRNFFFDIGVTNKEKIDKNDTSNPIYTTIEKYIKKLDADDVFISHWDMDHVLGIVYNKKCLYGKTWIGPDMGIIYKNEPPLPLIRLTNHLITEGKSRIFFVDTRDQTKAWSLSNELTLFLGEPSSSSCKYKTKDGKIKKHTINDINNGGILLSIELNNTNLLFTGDCDNKIIPSNATQTDYVVVPHHGSIMNDPVVRAKPGKDTKAFICIGNVTGKFTKDPDIVTKYISNQGFSEVLETKDLNSNCYYKVILQ